MSYQDEMQLKQQVTELETLVTTLRETNAITADQKLRKWALKLADGGIERADLYIQYVKTGSSPYKPQDAPVDHHPEFPTPPEINRIFG